MLDSRHAKPNLLPCSATACPGLPRRLDNPVNPQERRQGTQPRRPTGYALHGQRAGNEPATAVKLLITAVLTYVGRNHTAALLPLVVLHLAVVANNFNQMRKLK